MDKNAVVFSYQITIGDIIEILEAHDKEANEENITKVINEINSSNGDNDTTGKYVFDIERDRFIEAIVMKIN